jgi:hypothetical protein
MTLRMDDENRVVVQGVREGGSAEEVRCNTQAFQKGKVWDATNSLLCVFASMYLCLSVSFSIGTFPVCIQVDLVEHVNTVNNTSLEVPPKHHAV